MKRFYIFPLIGVFLFLSCEDSLNEKPSSVLVVPSSLQDFQALLNYSNVMNKVPSLGEIAADNYYVHFDIFQALSDLEKNTYTWQKDVFGGMHVGDWNSCYMQVFNTNVVLEGLEEIARNPANSSTYDFVKGQALFFRAHAFYQLLQIFSVPYSSDAAQQQPGIPLRLRSDINIKSVRSAMEDCYERIIMDLKEAATLLPVQVQYKTQPSKAAAYALLARTFLVMGRYSEAWSAADECLAIYDGLMDFNTLDENSSNPISRFNEEVIFHATMANYGILQPSRATVDTLIYNSYGTGDLRRTIFFGSQINNRKVFKGSYDGSILLFGGISTNEVILMRAECYARTGETELALNDLNTLLAKRWKEGTFVPLAADNSQEALRAILAERRKELLFRGIRWSDLRRLNQEPAWATTLTRKLDDVTFTLPPEDDRYSFPIPPNVIQSNPDMPQNPR